jgi:hypothetical protein
MVLHCEYGQLSVGNALVRAIGQVAVSGFPFLAQALLINGEAVVLRSDGDPVSIQVDDRVVAAPVPELELVAFRASGLREQLVAQANPEYRQVEEFHKLVRLLLEE